MKSVCWKDNLYYLILPLTILIYYILILKGNINNGPLVYDGIFVYNGLGNVFMFFILVLLFYFTIYNLLIRDKYILIVLTSTLILAIGEISNILYTLTLSTPSDIYISYGQSGVVYALLGFVFINSLNQVIHYKKMKLEIKIVAPIIFIASAIPLMDPFLGFFIMKGVAYQVHIMAYFLGIVVGSVLQVLFFEDFGIYSKVSIFLNKGVMENE